MGSPGDMIKHLRYWRISKTQLSKLDTLLYTLGFTRKWKEAWADTLSSPAFMRTQIGLQAPSYTAWSHFKFKQPKKKYLEVFLVYAFRFITFPAHLFESVAKENKKC